MNETRAAAAAPTVEAANARTDTPTANRDSRAPEPFVLTVDQAATMLQTSTNTLYSLIGQNVIPHVRLGRLIRIPRWGLLQFIAQASGAPLTDADGVAISPVQSLHVEQPAAKEEG